MDNPKFKVLLCRGPPVIIRPALSTILSQTQAFTNPNILGGIFMYQKSKPILFPEEIESYHGPDGIFYPVKEVCKVFEIEDVDQAVAELDPDEKQEIIVQTEDLSTQEILAVRYAGLLTLMLRSQSPLAKKVRRWITHRAIPDLFSGQGYIDSYDSLPKDDSVQLGIAHWVWN